MEYNSIGIPHSCTYLSHKTAEQYKVLEEEIKKLKGWLTEKQDDEAMLIAALEQIEAHYFHPNHDHNWAYWVNERVKKALKQG